MHFKLSGVVLLGVAAATTIAFAGCGDEDDGDDGEGSELQTLSYYESKGGDFQPIGDFDEESGPSVGDGFALNIGLEDESGDSVGELNAVCTFTAVGGRDDDDENGVCTAAAQLQDGQLFLAVNGPLGPAVDGAITGGTGGYAGATGTFESSKAEKGEPTEDTFSYYLPEGEDSEDDD